MTTMHSLWREVAGSVIAERVQTITLDASNPTYLQADIGLDPTPEVTPIATGGGWCVSIEDEESFSYYTGQVSVIMNSPRGPSGKSVPVADIWTVRLRFEADPLTPVLTVRAYATFTVFASIA